MRVRKAERSSENPPPANSADRRATASSLRMSFFVLQPFRMNSLTQIFEQFGMRGKRSHLAEVIAVATMPAPNKCVHTRLT